MLGQGKLDAFVRNRQETSASILSRIDHGRTSPLVAREHELLREIAYLRDLLGKVADDVEQSGTREDDPRRKRWFESRAKRINELVSQPVPANWSVATSTRRR